ncbi:MAG: hypothetical protein WCZ68_03565 [Sedimentibacter sp.]
MASGILQDPAKMENIIGMVRTFAPLTSPQTISKVNTYLPAVEKASTLLGMYSFISKAQNFRSIQAIDAKTPADKVTALLKNGNIPIAKLMAKPLLAGNMDKIMGALAMNMAKNGGLNEILSSLTNGNNSSLNEMLSSFSDGNKDNTDLSSLIETFKPMINNVMSSSNTPEESNELYEDEVFKSAQFDYKKNDKIDNKHINTPPSAEKNIRSEKYVQKPIRIRQRRR